MSLDHPSPDTDALFFTSLVTPADIAENHARLTATITDIAAAIAKSPRPRLYFIGGGASLAAMHGGKYLLDRFSSVPSDVLTGWQFISRNPASLDENSFLFLTSYSGQTPEVLQ